MWTLQKGGFWLVKEDVDLHVKHAALAPVPPRKEIREAALKETMALVKDITRHFLRFCRALAGFCRMSLRSPTSSEATC